jgi:hypothetical protein
MPPPPSPYEQSAAPKEDVKYLRLHFNRRLTWHKHIFAKRKELGISITKMYWLLGCKSKLYAATSLSHIKQDSNQSVLMEHNLRVHRPLAERYSRKLPIRDFVHDSGCTLVHTATAVNTGLASVHSNDLVVNLVAQHDNNNR